MRIFCFFILFLFCFDISAQEICNNAIDDDNDGLIDINDDDCICNGVVPASLIPNPSFEEMSCCPTGEGQLDCANDWVQASTPTTDYVHTCGVLSNPFIPYNADAPVPFPDGEGGIGFRDGRPDNANYKEYAGACLLEPMKTGTEYRLDFFVGFQDEPGSLNFPMALFASTDCDHLPFGIGNVNLGCPTNGPNWVQLGEFSASGENEWINVVFEFTAAEDYAVIALGPACDPHPDFDKHPYFFFDRLVLSESAEFGIPYSEISGGICTDDLTLIVEEGTDFSFQWYKNGIAIIGETDNTIVISQAADVEGVYAVLIETENGCFLSEEYEVIIPIYDETIEDNICAGEIYLWQDDELSAEGSYPAFLTASDGCDSMVTLNLNVLQHSESQLLDTICDGETFSLFNINTTEGGFYQALTSNAVGCDSTINIQLDLVEANEGIELGMDEEIILGYDIDLSPFWYDSDITSFEWSDENGIVLGLESELSDYSPLATTELYLSGFDQNGCPAIDTITVRVEREIDIYIPNIFSPNGDGINDFFQFNVRPSVIGIRELYIYDRWGELVFSTENISMRDYLGWNGKFKGQEVVNGVYSYMVSFDIIDGTEEKFVGDVTVLR